MHTQLRAERESPGGLTRSTTNFAPQRRETRVARNVERRANGLGWFSVGLGLTQIFAPRALARLIGVRGNDDIETTMRALGMRELASGIGILTQTQPAGFLWGRVAGDLMDLALLGVALSRAKNDRGKVAFATASVAAVTVLDALTAYDTTRGKGTEKERVHLAKSVTINGTFQEIQDAWREFMADEEDVAELEVRFEPAPGDRGIQVHARHPKKMPVRVEAQLRRFKQRVELGEVVHSDASIHRGPHPARPAKDEVLP